MFVCTAALAILDRLDVIDQETLGWWLAERQLPNGGLNGRPEKLEDVRTHLFILPSQSIASTNFPLLQVCYSFWALSAMSALQKLHWIDADKLISFILSAQVRYRITDASLALTSMRNLVSRWWRHRGSPRGYGGRISYSLRSLRQVYCPPVKI